MRKLIASINMTLDGFCDHTAITPDEEMHQHYADLVRNAGVLLYGRVTYQLMEYWREVVQNPTGDRATDDFARAIDQTPKIVFSKTLNAVDWHSATLSTRTLEDEVQVLRQQPGNDAYVGSPGLIAQLTNLGLIDEFQIFLHPVIAGSGLPLFRDIHEQVMLRLIKTRTFAAGGVILYYEPAREPAAAR